MGETETQRNFKKEIRGHQSYKFSRRSNNQRLYILIGIMMIGLLYLCITNPTKEDLYREALKEELSGNEDELELLLYTTDLGKEFKEFSILIKRRNYFVLSTYEYISSDDRLIGIANNFYQWSDIKDYFKSIKLKASWLPEEIRAN